MDQIVIPYAGAPGIAALTALQAAVEDGKFHIVGIILLERLLVCAGHADSPPGETVWTKNDSASIPHMIFNYSKSINKSPYFMIKTVVYIKRMSVIMDTDTVAVPGCICCSGASNSGAPCGTPAQKKAAGPLFGGVYRISERQGEAGNMSNGKRVDRPRVSRAALWDASLRRLYGAAGRRAGARSGRVTRLRWTAFAALYGAQREVAHLFRARAAPRSAATTPTTTTAW